ncbi:hypothetical protein P280DRAFT_519467 [Massarina eburnea CBS 473.64]|uniref:Uncharacterized protein n=1 Tax=Massarina eburnea CBS 473.64 TaxID=1395130 RepID=A0A6A6RVU2_9PLEO|nr:hypothetical protein P280DRAFT_519467 [Massarina eburnea CBS 473.64]
MAHQADVLPWQSIADHFRFVYSNQKHRGRTNLYPASKPGQGEQLQNFARVFATLVNESVSQERERYAKDVTPPAEDEVFIQDSTARRIAKTVASYKAPDMLSTPQDTKDRTLTNEERRLSHWLSSLNKIKHEDRLYDSVHPLELRECVELLKTLLLYGEMEPLLRLASHPDVDLRSIWTFPWQNNNYGWTDVKNCALMSYLCFNIFLAKPELWDPVARTKRLGEMKQKYGLAYTEQMYDYRNTKGYQRMLLRCTWTRRNNYDVSAHPHRDFLGIQKDMITTPSWSQLAMLRVGMGPPSSFVDARYRSWYVPTASDVSLVLSFLKTKVPTELALQILADADFTPKRLIPVPNDPLHVDNSVQLHTYIGYCWKVLVRVEMLLNANGSWADWEHEVTDALFELFGVQEPRMSVVYGNDAYVKEFGRRGEGEVEGAKRKRRRFVWGEDFNGR